MLCFQIIYIKHNLLISIRLAALPFELYSFSHCVIEDNGDKMMASYWKVGFLELFCSVYSCYLTSL
jgi:hypothetical protein